MPPPADAASLGKYADIPVNMNTGIPSISVPIYDIKTPRLEVPINLSYCSSGVKVDDLASWVGLGWSLNAGGVITRTVKGVDDFAVGRGYYNVSVPLGDTLGPFSWAYMDSLMNGQKDAQPDYFFYNFLNSSGKFVFGQDKKPLFIEYNEPLNIQVNVNSTTFTVLDGKGNQYLFGAKENAESNVTGPSGPGNNQWYISAWYLTQIISFDKTDTIKLKYYADSLLQQTFAAYSETLGPQYSCVPGPLGETLQEGSPAAVTGQGAIASESILNSNPLRLQEIDFRNGKVVFYSSETRSDLAEAKLDSVIVFRYDPEYATYDVLKRVKLVYDYFLSSFTSVYPTSLPTSGSRLRLDTVKSIGANNEDGGKYSFLYDSTMLPIVGCTARDLFNYYNGESGNGTLVPYDTVDYAGGIYYMGGAKREVEPSVVQAGVLKHIYYPTGGRTDFVYEPNQYFGNFIYNWSANEEAKARGYSTYQMGSIGETDTVTFTCPTSVAATVTAIISPYNYPDVHKQPFVSFVDLTSNTIIYLNGSASPTQGLNVSIPYTVGPGHTYQLIATAYQSDSVSSSITVSWAAYDTANMSTPGGGLRVRQITDYDYSGRFVKSEVYKYGQFECGYGYMPSPTSMFNTFTKPVYINFTCGGTNGPGYYNCGGVSYTAIQANANSIYDIFNLSAAPLMYPEVAKYQVDSLGNDIGKSVYDFTVTTNGQLPVSDSYNNGVYVTNGWGGGKMISESDYANKNGVYWPIRRTYFNYKDTILPQGRGVISNLTYSVNGPCTISGANGTPGFYAFDYPINTGATVLLSNVENDYNQNDTTKYVTKQTQNFYNNLNNLQPTRVVRNMSDMTSEITINRYAADMDSITGLNGSQTAALDSMVNQHNIATLIQQQTFRDSLALGLIKYDYLVWPGGLIAQDSIEAEVAINAIEKRVQFYGYDTKGNVAEDSKSSDVLHSYIWDYNDSYPIAEVLGAGSSDIAYTSFEADGSGGWIIPDTTRYRAIQAITGNLCYSLNANNAISKTGLNTGITYVVTYWVQGTNNVILNGEISANLKASFGSWNLYETTVGGTTSLTVGGTGVIDELRMYPQGCQMTTCTYMTLVGMTSKCDASGKIIYYQYDGLGRLKLIVDQYGNILKRYDYEYQISNQ